MLLSEYLKKWYFTYKPMSHAFSQSYHNVAVQRERQAVKGGEVTGLECTSELILLFSELDEVNSKHSLGD